MKSLQAFPPKALKFLQKQEDWLLLLSGLALALAPSSPWSDEARLRLGWGPSESEP